MPAPTDALTRGSFVLAAYAALALGDATLSAKLVLQAGGDADLSRLRLIDRAVGLEMLSAVAFAANDLDSAESWLGRLAPLQEHRIVAAALDRANAEGSTIEAAEGELFRARARIAGDEQGCAARDLATAVSDATARGHAAFHRAAARELRHVGRRLPPVAASGWEGLSPREREVGCGTRSGVAATLAPALRLGSGDAGRPAPLPDLTDRQREVVALLIGGASNKKIAESLGMSAATAEKHVSAVLQRWNVTSRAAIVALASGLEHEGAA